MTSKNDSGKTSHAPSVFASEIDGFTASTKLSRRETDIVVALIRNITNSEEVAKALGISTHTVNNHLKSIFEKTSTNSKTEILSSFLRYAADRMQHRQVFARRPKVLVVGEEPVLCSFIANGLRDRGIRTFTSTEPEQAAELARRLHVDFVICDINMADRSGMDLLKDLRRINGAWPGVLFIVAQPTHSLEECMHFGATGAIEKPLDIDQLFRTIAGHLVESLEEKSRLLNIDMSSPIHINLPCQLKASDIGTGGAFVPFDAAVQKRNRLTVGTIVDITLAPVGGSTTFKVRGRVAWRRLASEASLQAGIGLQFLDVHDADQRMIDDLLVNQNTASYIPIGASGNEVTLRAVQPISAEA